MKKYPTILEFHPGTHCRLNCRFCYRGGKYYQTDRVPMDGDTLKKLILDFAKIGGQEFYISGGLEPFSQWETVCHALLLAHNAGLKIRIYTNGTEPALQKNWVQELLLCTTEQIRFSVHAISKNVYSKITGLDVRNAKTTFSDVIKYIQSLLEKRTEDWPQIGIGFVINEHNLSEFKKAVHFWSKFGIDFLDIRFNVYDYGKINNSIKNEVESLLLLANSNCFSPLRISVSNFYKNQQPLPKLCFSPFRKIVVDPFGLVWPCCLQAQPCHQPAWAYLGDLSVQTYQEIVENIPDKFPRQHCKFCTPYELHYNYLQQQKCFVTSTSDSPRTKQYYREVIG